MFRHIIYRRGNRCHNSSVTNGIKGCRSLIPPSRTVYSVSWADFFCSGVPSFINGLEFSYNVRSIWEVRYNIDVAELIQPVDIDRIGRLVEFPSLKSVIGSLGRFIESMQNPSFDQSLPSRFLHEHNPSGRVPFRTLEERNLHNSSKQSEWPGRTC